MPSQNETKAYTPPFIPTPALVADVELLKPFTPIEYRSTDRAARILLRVHRIPIGYCDIVRAQKDVIERDDVLGALDAETQERIANHLSDDFVAHGIQFSLADTAFETMLDRAVETLPECALSMRPSVQRSVTVAICTRDRPASLERTLISLQQQSYPHIDILVIDNQPSNDAVKQLVQQKFPSVRYIREMKRGLDNARNRAVRETHNDIIAFIDDDAVADSNWAHALVDLFEDTNVMCVTGLVIPQKLDTAGQEMFERYGYSKGFQRRVFCLAQSPSFSPGFPYKGYIGTGCNCAFRRVVFERIGLFDPRLDMGTPVPGGGDHDMFARVIRGGYKLVYDPSPMVFHEHISSLTGAIARLGEYQESFMAFITKAILADREYGLQLLAHTAYWYIRRTARGIAAAAVMKKHRPWQLVWSEAIGAWRGPISLYRSHRQIDLTVNGTLSEQILPPVMTRHE